MSKDVNFPSNLGSFKRDIFLPKTYFIPLGMSPNLFLCPKLKTNLEPLPHTASFAVGHSWQSPGHMLRNRLEEAILHTAVYLSPKHHCFRTGRSTIDGGNWHSAIVVLTNKHNPTSILIHAGHLKVERQPLTDPIKCHSNIDYRTITIVNPFSCLVQSKICYIQ